MSKPESWVVWNIDTQRRTGVEVEQDLTREYARESAARRTASARRLGLEHARFVFKRAGEPLDAYDLREPLEDEESEAGQ